MGLASSAKKILYRNSYILGIGSLICLLLAVIFVIVSAANSSDNTFLTIGIIFGLVGFVLLLVFWVAKFVLAPNEYKTLEDSSGQDIPRWRRTYYGVDNTIILKDKEGKNIKDRLASESAIPLVMKIFSGGEATYRKVGDQWFGDFKHIGNYVDVEERGLRLTQNKPDKLSNAGGYVKYTPVGNNFYTTDYYSIDEIDQTNVRLKESEVPERILANGGGKVVYELKRG